MVWYTIPHVTRKIFIVLYLVCTSGKKEKGQEKRKIRRGLEKIYAVDYPPYSLPGTWYTVNSMFFITYTPLVLYWHTSYMLLIPCPRKKQLINYSVSVLPIQLPALPSWSPYLIFVSFGFEQEKKLAEYEAHVKAAKLATAERCVCVGGWPQPLVFVYSEGHGLRERCAKQIQPLLATLLLIVPQKSILH